MKEQLVGIAVEIGSSIAKSRTVTLLSVVAVCVTVIMVSDEWAPVASTYVEARYSQECKP